MSLEIELPEGDAKLDALLLSALMSSRLCHDLVNPVGALSSGLEVLNDEDMGEDMREEALDLVKTSADKAVAALKYARLAYGLAGGYAHDVPFDEAKQLLSDVYAFSKAELSWELSDLAAPKEEVKSLLLLVHAAADCVPRGGEVVVSGGGGDYQIRATGKRVILHADVPKALDGELDDLKPKQAPLFIAGLLARRTGGAASAQSDEEAATIKLKFVRPAPSEAAPEGDALTGN